MDYARPRGITPKNKLAKGAVVKTAFDNYILIEQVGSGGNGRVFSALNESGEHIAIKFLERNIEREKLKRFKNEIAFCEHHQHKNIVPILDRGIAYLDEKDFVFYVMPLYADTLKKKIAAGISPDDAVNIFLGILEGLKYAHEHHAIHRDIKPANILFATGSCEPVICDFGIAHFSETDLLTAVETKPGDRMANFYYAAPEQYKHEVVKTPQTDIYSAALILNEMFTKEIPKAAGYKKIADINADYAYLDNVFEQIYIQEPTERLYPEDKIFTEMKIRSEQHQRKQEILKLQQTIDSVTSPENFNAIIVKKDHVNERLVFTLDQEIPNIWFQILSSENFGDHATVIGYGPGKLIQENKHTICMRLRGDESLDTIKRTVVNVIDWVAKTNIRYSSYIKEVAKEEQNKKEQARKAQIEKPERDNSINTLLAQL